MDFLGTSYAFISHGGHVYRFFTVFYYGIHDSDFLIPYQNAPRHKLDHVCLINGLGYPGNMFKGRLHQLTVLIVIDKRGCPSNPKGILRNPVLIPLWCRIQGLLHQGSQDMKMPGGLVKSGQTSIFKDLSYFR